MVKLGRYPKFSEHVHSQARSAGFLYSANSFASGKLDGLILISNSFLAQCRQKPASPPPSRCLDPACRGGEARSCLLRRYVPSTYPPAAAKHKLCDAIGPSAWTSAGHRVGQKRQALVHAVIDTAMVVGELLVTMRNAELVQPPHEPAGAVE